MTSVGQADDTTDHYRFTGNDMHSHKLASVCLDYYSTEVRATVSGPMQGRSTEKTSAGSSGGRATDSSKQRRSKTALNETGT